MEIRVQSPGVSAGINNRKILRSLCSAGLLLVISLCSLKAQVTIRVPGQYATIQAAVGAASNGDTILVGQGTYYGPVNFSGKTITVKSEQGLATTILDGNGADSVVIFGSGESRNAVLQGFTIQNGRSSSEGGGIRIWYSSPTIIGNRISNNSAANGGGGIGISFGSPLIRDNTVSNNGQTPGYSGGIGGGGISVGGSASAEIYNNAIVNNTWNTADGGGLSLFAAGTPMISGNRILDNMAYGNGGGIAMHNQADAAIINNLITGNSAGGSGGGIYFLVPSGARGPWLINNTIAGNSSPLGPGVLADGFNSQSEFINNIIVGRPGETAVYCGAWNPSSYPLFKYNDVFAPSGAPFGGSCPNQTGLSGNLSADPLFTSPDTGGYLLGPGSPAIDSGTSDRAPATDLAGAARPLDGNSDGTAAFDMGAYEAAPPPAPKAVVSPASVIFAGLTPVGSTSAPAVVTLTNAGNAVLLISGIGTTGAFAQTNNCGSPLGIGFWCSISVTFAPQAAGIQAGTLTITDNAAGSPRTVALSGSGALYAEAESLTNTLFGQARVEACSVCSGGAAVGRLSNGSLRINSVGTVAEGPYQVEAYYRNTTRSARTIAMSVNGGSPTTLSLPVTSSSAVGLVPVTVSLSAGANAITFSNASSANVQIDRISVHQ